MNIRPIRTEQDYQDALKSVSPLFDNEPDPGTPEGDYLEVMITLIEAYEAKHFPVDLPNPVDAIRFRMEQSGLSAAAAADNPDCRQLTSYLLLAVRTGFMRCSMASARLRYP